MNLVFIGNITYLCHLQEQDLNLVDGQDLLSELEDRLASGELSYDDVENILQDYTRKSK